MSIGFLDSGIGGLTVLAEAKKRLPEYDFLYYADVDNAPYGEKTKIEVKNIVFNAVKFLIDKGCKIIVLACNTATSVAVAELREKYFDIPIIGMEPAIKPAVINSEKGKRILVLATELTLKEEKFNNLVLNLDKDNIIDVFPAGELVKLAETGKWNDENYLISIFKNFDLSKYFSIVLGCTHFIYFKKTIKKIVPSNIKIIDGNTGTVNNLVRLVEKNGIKRGSGDIKYFKSGKEIKKDDFIENSIDKYLK